MSSYLTRQTTVPTSEKKFTFSTWIKVSGRTGADNGIIEWYRDANNRHQFLIDSTSSKFRCYSYQAGSVYIDIHSDAVFRDPSAWSHIVVHSDTTEASASDRFKMWVNGVAQTFSTYTWSFAQNVNINVFDGTSGDKIQVGSRNNGNFFDGLVADTYYIDGSLIAHTQFGETDSTSGIWKPKTSPTIASFGNAGFHCTYEDSSNLGDDTSGNGLDFSLSGTPTQTEDTPSNNFATLNPLIPIGANFSNGNLTHSTTSSGYKTGLTTLGVSSGKWYSEFKITTDSSYLGMGVANFDKGNINAITYLGDSTNGVIFHPGSQTLYYNAGNPSWTGTSCVNGDIIGIALDLDNGFIYWHKNGTYMNSGVPTSGATGTGGYAVSNIANSDGTGTYAFGVTTSATSGTRTLTCNFGNGYFGTTAVASSNSDSAGLGLFEYSVPSGYYALCTKNIKNYG